MKKKKRQYREEIPNEGLTGNIDKGEMENALNKMKNGKAACPVEAWKALGEEVINLLWDLMRKVCIQEEITNEWRKSTIF